jgi:hypothetical protein
LALVRALPHVRRAVALALACAGGLACAVGAPASAATPAEAIARLNAQRAANGIPAGIVENAALSQGCAHHNDYIRANGGQLTHQEDPSRPGYTDDGAYAGLHSVLASGGSWNGANPWESAPIHLSQLLAPRLDVTGVDDSGGLTCAQTLASRNRPAPAAPVTYTYPGNGTTIYASEIAFESPTTPGALVGIPEGASTGPYLYVLFDGPWSEFADAHLTAAALRGPGGPVVLKVVDNSTPGLEGYLPPGGMLIPRVPLLADTSYTASVTGTVTDRNGGATFGPVSYRWTFRTRPAAVCRVPALLGRTLTTAGVLLRRAGCRLGRVHYRRGGRGGFRVVAQTPGRGAVRRGSYAIAVALRRR